MAEADRSVGHIDYATEDVLLFFVLIYYQILSIIEMQMLKALFEEISKPFLQRRKH
jgi:hypothetical protein